MKTFDPGEIPLVGGELTLTPDDKTESAMHVSVLKTRGLAEIMEVKDDDSGMWGLVAFQPDGSWYWIRKIEKREAWEGDPNSWKSQADGR